MTRHPVKAATAAAGLFLAAAMLAAAGTVADDRSAIFGVRLPQGYRDWRVISVAHEAGANDDLRAVLGNDIALEAARAGRRPFPDGAVMARVAWRHTPSPVNDAVFGRPQSFVAGEPTNVQISVKDSKAYAASGGWGYGQFEAGRPNRDVQHMATCFPCHAKLPPAEDFVFTRYAP